MVMVRFLPFRFDDRLSQYSIYLYHDLCARAQECSCCYRCYGDYGGGGGGGGGRHRRHVSYFGASQRQEWVGVRLQKRVVVGFDEMGNERMEEEEGRIERIHHEKHCAAFDEQTQDMGHRNWVSHRRAVEPRVLRFLV